MKSRSMSESPASRRKGNPMKRPLAAATVVATLAMMTSAVADSFPTKTIKLLCWTSPGSPLDVMMRHLGKGLAAIFRQTVIVENRTGGSGAAAMAALINQPADGYTILSTTSSMSFTMATGRIPFGPDNFTVLPALQSETLRCCRPLRQSVPYAARIGRVFAGPPRPAEHRRIFVSRFSSIRLLPIAGAGRVQVRLDTLQRRPGGRLGIAWGPH